jgi:N-acetylmuramic acid 6-phosphate etherase
MTVTLPATEGADARYAGLDTWRDDVVLGALLDGQRRGVAAVEAAIPDLARAARVAAERVAAGGRLVYLAAGSPALISLGDALEIPQTYGVPRDRILLLLAGGKAIFETLTGIEEDDGEQAQRDVAGAGINAADCVIATSASGTTPYTVAGLKAAKTAGAATIGIAGNAGAPLIVSADIGVFLDSGPEVISGSTRMGAGTAQKAALNMLSTLIGVRLGHVYDGQMINFIADNDKLRGRAARVITRITGADNDHATRALEQTDGAIKPAILIAAGAKTPVRAGELLARTKGNLREALALLGATTAR